MRRIKYDLAWLAVKRRRWGKAILDRQLAELAEQAARREYMDAHEQFLALHADESQRVRRAS